MNREPLVSVVMSVRNGECTLRDSGYMKAGQRDEW